MSSRKNKHHEYKESKVVGHLCFWTVLVITTPSIWHHAPAAFSEGNIAFLRKALALIKQVVFATWAHWYS
jgi:hypothetical protein